jgi:iron complex outermembrane receptor protein
VIALDRRDISFGATATDIIDSPFSTEPARGAGLAWENDNKSDWSRRACSSPPTSMIGDAEPDAGRPLGRLRRQVARHRRLSYQIAGEQKASKGKATYTASLTYKLPGGLMPYITYAKASALEMSQAGDVAPAWWPTPATPGCRTATWPRPA